MRAFGQGSLSSFLKAVLDVVVYALWGLLALTTLGLAVAHDLAATVAGVEDRPWHGRAPAPHGRFT